MKNKREENGEKLTPQRIAASREGMVSTAQERATGAGAEILADGGNAVDAAVAAALALCVCEPQACGIGGQTMMMIHLAEERRNIALDGSSRAPNRAAGELFDRKGTRLRGWRATTVPSTPAVLAYAARTYGRLPLSRLLEPAIRLAGEGYHITELQHRLQVREEAKWPRGNAKDFFLDGGKPWAPGSLFRQPVLADTLRRMAKEGVEDFYQGEIGRRILADMEKHEGLIQADDLAHIPWPIERRPVSCRFEDMRILSFPPPGAGRTLVEMFNIIANFPEKQRNLDTCKGAVLLAEVIRRAQLDRRDRPYDPNLYPQVEDRKMTGQDYARLVARQIRARLRAKGPSRPLAGGEEGPPVREPGGGETTHLSVMDRQGNTVGLTQSIERVYGSFAVAEELGFIYNNYMSAFDYEDMTHPYYIRPNGVPWASVTPSVVFRGRRPTVVIGSPGSERITSVVFQVLLRLRRQSPIDAVVAPRLHASATGRVSFEAPWMRDDIPAALERRGFRIDPREAFSFHLGCVQLVAREGQTLIGVADPRRDGSARGPE